MKRRLQVDIPDSLARALASVCEDLAMSKSDFVQRSILESLRLYCEKNPAKANESLVDLLKKSEAYLLD